MTNKSLGRKSIRTNLLAPVAATALLLGNIGCQCIGHHNHKDGAIAILRQPKSRIAKVGTEVEFEPEVAVREGAKTHFQWFLNGSPLDPSTAKELGITGVNERKLRIGSVATDHVGFYSCTIESESEVAVTEPAELMVFHHSVLTVFGTPIAGGGAAGAHNCPPKYKSYVCFRKPDAPFGWRLLDPTVAGKASDPNRTDTVVRYFGAALAKNGCGAQSVTVPTGADAYRFTIYFLKDPAPSGPYSIQLDGFEE